MRYVDKAFRIPLNEMRKIIKDFHSEMKKGLSGQGGSLKMIPTYVDRPTGNERGRFIALDLGGTNFRILEVELRGNAKYKISKVKKFILDKRYLTGSAEEFFGFIADCIKIFIEAEPKMGREDRRIGFTFSFPVNQTGIASGTLVRWTKGFNVKGVLGEDVVRLLNVALERKGLNNIRIQALANDTVGTLVARAYEKADCDIGVIIGTGTNACYVSGHMIVNIEWGNFNKLRLSAYDRQLDAASDRPGQQILEKVVSGMYLGEIARLIFRDLIKRKLLFKDAGSFAFDRPKSFKTEYMSIIENDRSANLSRVNNLLKGMGIKNLTINDRRLVKRICALVSLRAARVSASAIAAVITKIDPHLSGNHIVAIDGTLYEKHPHFSKNMECALKEIFKKKASRIKMVLTKDGSGRGAAIIAAIATHDYHG